MTTVYLIIAGLVLISPTSDFTEAQIFLVKDEHQHHVAELCWDSVENCIGHKAAQNMRKALDGVELSVTVDGSSPIMQGTGTVGSNIPEHAQLAYLLGAGRRKLGWVAQVRRFHDDADCGTIKRSFLESPLDAKFAARLKIGKGQGLFENCLFARYGRTTKRGRFEVPGTGPEHWNFSEVVVLRLDFKGAEGPVKIVLKTPDGRSEDVDLHATDCGKNKCAHVFLTNLTPPQACKRFPTEAHDFRYYYDFSKETDPDKCPRRIPEWEQNGRKNHPTCHPGSKYESLEGIVDYLHNLEAHTCVDGPRGVSNRPICLQGMLFQP